MSCLAVSDRLMYSASVDDKAIVFCFLETQLTGPPANFTTLPVTDFWLATSAAQSAASANAINPSLFLPLYVIFTLSIDLTYFTMYSAFLMCSSEGFTMNCDIRITA